MRRECARTCGFCNPHQDAKHDERADALRSPTQDHDYEVDWVDPELIVHVFETSQFAFLASMGLLLFSTATSSGPHGQALQGISWKTLQLNLLAAIARLPFQFMTHFFDYWITFIEIVSSIVLLGVLVAMLEFGRMQAAGPRPREDFNSLAAVGLCLALASVPGLLHPAGYLRYTSLAFSVFLEVRATTARRRRRCRLASIRPPART